MPEQHTLELLHFDARVTDYRESPVLVTRTLFYAEANDEKYVIYSAWSPREKVYDVEDYLSRIQTFQDFTNSDLVVLFLVREQRQDIANLIRKAYPLEADPATITTYGLNLKGAGFVAWWNEVGSKLELENVRIDMGYAE